MVILKWKPFFSNSGYSNYLCEQNLVANSNFTSVFLRGFSNYRFSYYFYVKEKAGFNCESRTRRVYRL